MKVMKAKPVTEGKKGAQQGYEESDEGYEGEASHRGEERKGYRKRPASWVSWKEEKQRVPSQPSHIEETRVQWPPGPHAWWTAEVRLHSEPSWQDCQQEDECSWEEEAMDGCRGPSAEGFGYQRSGDGEERHAVVQEGQGVHGEEQEVRSRSSWRRTSEA